MSTSETRPFYIRKSHFTERLNKISCQSIVNAQLSSQFPSVYSNRTLDRRKGQDKNGRYESRTHYVASEVFHHCHKTLLQFSQIAVSRSSTICRRPTSISYIVWQYNSMHRNNTTMTNQRLSSKPPSFLKPWFFSRVTDAANERYRLEEKSKDSKSRCRRASFQSAFSPRRVCLLCQRETTKYFSHLEYFFPTQCKTYFEVEDG